MFPVIDRFAAEAYRLTVYDPTNYWKSSRELDGYLRSEGGAEQLRVLPRGFGRWRGYDLHFLPALSDEAHRELKRVEQMRRCRQQKTGQMVKLRRTASLVGALDWARCFANRATYQR